MKFSVSNLACFQVRVINQIDNGFITHDSMLKYPWEWVHDLRNEGNLKTFLVHSAVCLTDCGVSLVFSVPFSACSLSQWWGKLLSMNLLRLSTTTGCGKQTVAEPTNRKAVESHHPNRLSQGISIKSSQSTRTGMMPPFTVKMWKFFWMGK